MRNETQFATIENVVTAICFGVGALLVVLALYTLAAVKTVNADPSPPFELIFERAAIDGMTEKPETFSLCCGSGANLIPAHTLKG